MSEIVQPAIGQIDGKIAVEINGEKFSKYNNIQKLKQTIKNLK